MQYVPKNHFCIETIDYKKLILLKVHFQVSVVGSMVNGQNMLQSKMNVVGPSILLAL
jgi:hypothetical protein